MLTNTEIADRLDGAAALIEERGHAKHHILTPDGRVCMNGAINLATFGDGAGGGRRVVTCATCHRPAEEVPVAPCPECTFPVCAECRCACQEVA